MAEATEDLQVRYRPSKTAKKFLKSNKSVRLIVGPFGSGKSSVCAIEALRRACSVVACKDGVRRSRGLIVRNTYPELRDTTRKTFEEWIPRECGTWVEGENKFLMAFDDGEGPVECEVLFRSLDTPADISKLLSLELTWAWLNEAKELAKAVFDVVQARVGRYPAKKNLPAKAKLWTGIWLDTNPPDEDHWIYRIFEEERPDGFEVFHQPGGRDPDAENLEYLQDGYYDRISAGKDAEWIKVYVDGKYGFVRDGKPVYPEWNDRLHVQECIRNEKFGPVLIGQDFGLTPAAVIGQRDPSDGQLQILDEFWSDDAGAMQFGELLVAKLKREYPGEVRGHGDPAGDQRAQTDEKTPFDVMRSVGLRLRAAPTNDFILRREAVARGLTRLTLKGRPSLVIDPKCKRLRKAMAGGYCYRRIQVSGDERFKDVPDKNHFSHVAEALQYLSVGEGEDRKAVPIADPAEFRLNLRVKRSIGRYR